MKIPTYFIKIALTGLLNSTRYSLPATPYSLLATRYPNGFAAMVSVLAIMSIGLILGSGFLYSIIVNTRALQNETDSLQGLYASESGIEDAIHRLRNNLTTVSPSTLAVGSATATTIITTVGDIKTITSEGSKNNVMRKSQATLQLATVGADFFYGAQVGEGGLIMNNNSIVDGSVYANGSIDGQPGSKITGDAWVAGGIAALPDAQWTTQNADFNVGVSPQVDAAQSFIPSVSQPIRKVSLFLKKIGVPSDTTIRIMENKSPQNVPDKNNILASGTMASSLVTSAYGWIDIALAANPTLTAGTTYWIMIDRSHDAAHYLVWGRDSADGYALGTGKYAADWNGSVSAWSSAGGDLDFKAWLGGTITKIGGMQVGDAAHPLSDAHANTIESSTIQRNAYFQTITGSTVLGIQYPGSADPPPVAMPISDGQIEAWKAEAVAGGVISSPCPYIPVNNASLGPVKIACDLEITGGNTFTVAGTIWVEGDIRINNSAVIQLAPGYGSSSGMVIASKPIDPNNSGKIEVSNNSQILGSGTAGSYLMLLSTNAAAQNGFSDIAINVSNNSSGAIFYTNTGKIQINNNGALKEATAYLLRINNNATLTYESGLANAQFSSGPSAGWKISGWKEIP